ncbi:helix-turn-helix domain-containing protein [candidate division KSB1 bacterium]|nr:helix-turn-helix domain-containing protein [candidate division KSB1 bacterium]MBL7093700.1 helix-turn-helix domain-containing protein [candidate division KSB1 bacterium]
MDTNNPQNSVLNKILQSESFKERDLYQKLLKYLVEASSKGEPPKEVTIAYDVFNKGKDFNTAEDTTVRVHVHNLRKKLESYYQTEGQSDEIKISIPKGHYQVKFIKNKKPELKPKKSGKNISLILLFIALFCSIIYIAVDKIYFQKQNKYFEVVDKNDVIWSNFFSNSYPTSVVIGDFLVFHEYDAELNRARRIQDYEINTVEELEVYAQKNLNKNVEKWSIGELPHNIIFNIKDIQPVFLSFNKKLEINFTSEIDINFIKNRNIVYIGEFKNLRALSDLLSLLPINYETLPWWHGTISFQVDDSLVTLNTSHDWSISRYVIDLALVAKLPGQSNENYLFIAGFGYNSQIKIVELFSHKSSLKNLEEKIKTINGDIPDYFVVVFEIAGFDRASSTAELKFFHKIEEDYYRHYYQPSSNKH